MDRGDASKLEGVPGRNASDFRWVGAGLFVGGIFAFAGFMKLIEPAANFQAVLERYPMVPASMAPALARTIPWMEWFGGMFLILGYQTRVSLWALSLLSLAFLVVLTGPVVWSVEGFKDCGCFGTSGVHLTLKQAYLLDWVNLTLGILLLLRKNHPLTLDNCFR